MPAICPLVRLAGCFLAVENRAIAEQALARRAGYAVFGSCTAVSSSRRRVYKAWINAPRSLVGGRVRISSARSRIALRTSKIRLRVRGYSADRISSSYKVFQPSAGFEMGSGGFIVIPEQTYDEIMRLARMKAVCAANPAHSAHVH